MTRRATAAWSGVSGVLVVAACSGEIRLPADARDADGGDALQSLEAGSASDSPPAPHCAGDTECGLSSLHCDPRNGACVECIVDAHCTRSEQPRCDAATQRCVECGVPGDCQAGKTCETTTRKCIPTCTGSGSCPSSAPTCDVTRGVCVECTVSSSCKEDDAHCENASGRCVECLVDGDCSSSTRHRCDTVAGRCVECLAPADCPSKEPYCEPSEWRCTGSD